MVGESVEHHRGELAHVTGHDQVLGPGFLHEGSDAGVSRFAILVAGAIEHRHGNADRARPLNAVGIGARGQHMHDFHGQAIRDLVDDGLQVRSAAGEQHADLQLLH